MAEERWIWVMMDGRETSSFYNRSEDFSLNPIADIFTLLLYINTLKIKLCQFLMLLTLTQL